MKLIVNNWEFCDNVTCVKLIVTQREASITTGSSLVALADLVFFLFSAWWEKIVPYSIVIYPMLYSYSNILCYQLLLGTNLTMSYFRERQILRLSSVERQTTTTVSSSIVGKWIPPWSDTVLQMTSTVKCQQVNIHGLNDFWSVYW